MYVITGATGNIGKVLVEELCKMGLKVRAVGRDKGRLEPAVQQGAEAFVGDASDPQSMVNAFEGARAVFTLIPPNPQAENYRAYQNGIADSFIQAIQQNNVKNVVNLTSLGAQIPEKTGPVSGFFDVENKMNAISGLNLLHLRPAFFMENTLMGLELVKDQGIFGTAIKPDVSFAMIATSDVGRYAAKRMAAMDFTGTSEQELFGQRDLSMAEAAQIIGKVIGKPDLPYIQFSYEDTKNAIQGMGVTENIADAFVELYQAINDGILRPTQERTTESTTPTSFEQWAETVYLYLYRS